LDAWLDANNPAEGTKWTLSEADGLTDTGLVTGRAIYDDGPGGQADGWRAFLLDASALVVPEPASIVLLGIGAAGLLSWRRRMCNPFAVGTPSACGDASRLDSAEDREDR